MTDLKKTYRRAILTALAVLFAFAAPAFAQYDIRDLGESVKTQDIQADSTGTVHIVWTNLGNIFYGKIVNNAITGKVKVASGINTIFWRPYVSVQPGGKSVHISWSTGGAHGNQVKHAWKTTTAGWKTETVATGTASQWLTQPTCVMDSSGVLHVLFVIWNDVPTAQWSTIFYRRKLAGGTWEAKTRLTPLTPEHKHPMLFVDSDGRVHATWDIAGKLGTDKYDAYYCSAPSGGKLSYANKVRLPKSPDSNVNGYGDLYVTKNGVVHRSIGGWSNAVGKMCIDHTKKPAGGSFQAPTRPSLGFLSLKGGDPVPAVVANEDGEVVVAWGQNGSDGSNTVKASFFDPGLGKWTLNTVDPAAGITTAPNAYRVAVTRTDTDLYGVWRGSNGHLKLLVIPFALPSDLLNTSDSDGVWYRNTRTSAWLPLSTPADLVTAGDVDGDSADDLIGVWGNELLVRSSRTSGWIKLSAGLPTSIASGDMNGDGRDDVVGSWASGVSYRDSLSGAWVLMSSVAASVIAAGDVDGDRIADLAGVWNDGLWVKSSSSGSWMRLSTSLPTDIAVGDMSGDGLADVVGSWPSGVWYRNSATGSWVMMSSVPASLLAARDVDGDKAADLIGLWTDGVWVKKSSTSGWVKITDSHPRDIDAGLFRTAEAEGVEGYAMPLLASAAAPGANGEMQDLSPQGPGGSQFSFVLEGELTPVEMQSGTVFEPGTPGLQFEAQPNLVPGEALEMTLKKPEKLTK